MLLLIVLVILLLGAAPTWGYSRPWGYRPVSGVGLLLVVLLLLLAFQVIPWWGWGPGPHY
jgi:hypothetical protein